MLELEGTFHQFASFCDEVGHLPRIVNIKEISLDIVTESKQEVLIRARAVASSYRYLDESERIGPGADGDVEKRRRGKKRRRPA